ncbi:MULTISPECIES: AMP-binding protein [unclassified Micromonospora]|uniref:AMP-binding protein n=1 Tax=unclassified Micromonospora TaxID=2617518 RepID=UPI00112B1524|nr:MULTISPECIES: AMP-binding protein [unclassified Micromonospora]MCK1810104.1 AMP-binding protein [Micromonospora sp. R42106]MCK1835321.1 AMP-binding protein [Micromonospora sp. R42003]MCK1847239.1 AMP-binding protein [Micromonospora sp. R42004]MCM1014610.1 AMP-binding protein [Micromonospora sp. XM-20-01]
MDLPFIAATLTRRGLLTPGRPIRVVSQLNALRRWGWSLAGELRQAAARDPGRVAVVDERGATMTYQELLERSERLARSLRSHLGVQAGDRVGVLCRNHHGLIEAIVAAMLLGADAVLVNTGLSAAQLGTVAEEQGLRVLVHDGEFTERVLGLPAEVHRVDERRHEELIAAAVPGEQLQPPERDGRTIVLTSGTTGAPKGARRPTPHGFGPLVSIIDRIPLHARNTTMIAAPIFHTWGYAALQVSFALRATVVLHRRFDPAATLTALVAQRCDAMFAVPVMLQRLMEVEPPLPRPPLKVVAVSGSALPGNLATAFMDRYGDVLYNLYGSTEVSWASIAGPRELRAAPTTAGRPPHGTRLAILDENGRPVRDGEVGRIFVGNEMLFEGYTSGVGRESRDGLLDTGDLGRLDADGLLFVDGRADDMIVSGGENVFPSEVEDLIARLPQVREVAVIGVPDPDYGERLAAFLALRPGETLDPEAVREYVRRYLARFSVPRDVVFVKYLPRNATGKVLSRELRRYFD